MGDSMEINRYRPTWAPMPKVDDVRELIDRTGKVQKLARVKSVDTATRQVRMDILDLDDQGRERVK